MRWLLFMLLLAPGLVFADVVDAESLIASPNGRFYVIVQQNGDVEIVRRGASNPPARDRVGNARPKMTTIKRGASAAEMAAATGITKGIQPDIGDAIIGETRLRDRLDQLRVFDDGTGFVARYASSPSRYEDLEPIRTTEGSDEGLVSVEQKPIGEDRVLASFVHLYTRKDAVFWGDSERKLVMMVRGGTKLTVTPESGASLADRASGESIRMVAWSYEDKKAIKPPFEALVDRIRTGDPRQGLVAFLLARDMDLRKMLPTLTDLVHDPAVPHPTRVHAAAALYAEGDRRGAPLILATARGSARPSPMEAPLTLEGANTDGALAVRSWTVSILPITHPEEAPDVLLGLVHDPVVGGIANGALGVGPWPRPEWTWPALVRAAGDLSREPKQRAAASRLLAAAAPGPDAPKPMDHPLWSMLEWLATDEDPQIHKPAIQALPALGDDASIPRLAAVLRADDSTRAARQDAAWSLANRAWRSGDAREVLIEVAGAPEGGPGAGAALGALWRVEDPRTRDILIQAAAKGGRAGAAALHSAFISARQSRDVEGWIVGLEQLPEQKGRLGRALRRNLAVLDPKRVIWAP